MNKTWLTLLIAAALLIGLLFVAAVASFLFLPQIQDWMTQPKGPVLIYEVDPNGLARGEQVDMDKLVRAVNDRLNSRWNRLARVRKLDGQQIEIAVIGKNPSDTQRVERLLACIGTLDFRILANQRDDKDLIRQALANPAKKRIRDKAGSLQAWWMPVKAGQESVLANYREIALRTKTRAGHTVTEVLVLNDEYNVTGAYLTHVAASVDSEGKPCVTFALNNEGGQLFGLLTESHLPDELTGFSYKLAIIFDDNVYSAPSIRGRITDNGQITGSFTNDDVDFLVNVLNSGSLPVNIRPVKKPPSEKK